MITRLLKTAAKLFWLLPGFLLWASFPPMGESMDVFFALAPLIWYARNNEPRASFRKWYANGLLFWIATLSWMPAIIANGGPWPLVVLGWGALSAYCALFFGAFGWLSSRTWGWAARRSYWWRLFALLVAEPVLWAGLELCRARLFGGFAWNQLGLCPVNAGLGSPAAVGGVYLVSALVVLVNGTIASIAERMLAPWLAARRRKEELRGGEVSVSPSPRASAWADVPKWLRSVETLLPFAVVWGAYGLSSHFAGGGEVGGTLSVAMVQRNFPCVFSGVAEDCVAKYSRLVSGMAPFRPDLLVLSESAFAEVGPLDGRRADVFARWLMRESGAKAVLGGGAREDGGRLYNSAALFEEGAPAAQVYDKVHLVPFGEYIPGDKLVTALQALAPVGSCTPGEPKLLDLGGTKVGVAICYEDADSALVRRFREMGAQVLVFMTNDSWFSGSVEHEQHSWQAAARAVETGLPVVRVGNSGVTGTVTAGGATAWLAAGGAGRPLVDKEGAMCSRVKYAAPGGRATPYVRVGDWPLAALFLAVALFALLYPRLPLSRLPPS